MATYDIKIKWYLEEAFYNAPTYTDSTSYFFKLDPFALTGFMPPPEVTMQNDLS